MGKFIKDYKLIIFLAIVFSLIVPCFIFAAEGYPDGTLIRAEDDYKIYLVFNGEKRWLKNIDVFNSYGFKWQDIKVVNPAVVKKISLNDLIREEEEVKVYVLNDFGYKRHIINPSIFESYGFKWDDIAVVSDEEINSYPESNLVRETGNPKVYFLEDNKKRWIDSIESFYTHNFDWEAVHIINKDDIDVYQIGEVVTPSSSVRKHSETPADVSPQTEASTTATTTELALPIASTATTTATTTPFVTPAAIPATPAVPVSSSATTTQPAIPAIPAIPAEPRTSTPSSSVSGPGTKKWEFAVSSYGTPGTSAIASDGTIYFGTGDGKLFALNSNGAEKWRFSAGINRVSTPAIGADGTIYVGSFDNKLYAVNPNGTLKWSFNVGSAIYSSPAIASDGAIYVGSYDKKLYALNPNGTQKWVFTTGDIVYSSPAIASDGAIYFGSLDNKLYALNPNGTQKWVFTTGGDVYSSPAIGSDGTIYIGSEDKKLYALNPNGTQKWVFTTGGGITSSPTVGSDGTIYVGSYDKKLYALNPNGSQKWVFNASSPTGGTDGILSSPAIDSNGVIYFGNRDYGIALQAVNPDGTLKWSFSAGSWITNSPSICSDGTVYVGADDYKFYAINTNSSGLANSSWPKFHKDNRNTGAYALSLTAADTVSPSIPANLTASSTSSSQINLSWTASTDNVGVAGYKIYRAGAQIGTSNTTNYSDAGLSPSTNYSYNVTAYDAAGNVSSQSASVNATTQTLADTNPPVISSISAYSITTNSTIITWTTDEAADSQVEYGLDLSYGAVATLDSSLVISHSVSLSNLTSGAIYHYKVISTDSAGNRDESGDATFTTISSAKPDLIIDDITIEKDTVTNPIPAYRYKVYVKNSGTADANKSSLRVTISPSQPQSIDNGADYTCPWGANFLIPNNDLVTGEILKIGETERARDYFNPVAAGSVTITATADIYGAVNESNETNNTMTKNFNIEQLIDSSKCPNACANNTCVSSISLQGILSQITRDLYLGARGDDVKHLQILLTKEVNYSANLLTGYFGNITQDAVKILQAKYGVRPVSGYFGEITKKALKAAISN